MKFYKYYFIRFCLYEIFKKGDRPIDLMNLLLMSMANLRNICQN